MLKKKYFFVFVICILFFIGFNPFSISHFDICQENDKPILLTANPNLIWSYDTTDYSRSIAISSDGEYFVLGNQGNEIHFFNKSSSQPMWTYLADGWVYGVAISQDGEYIAAGTTQGWIYFFNKSITPQKTPIWSYYTSATQSDGVCDVKLSDNGTYLAVRTSYRVYLFETADTSSPILWSYSMGSGTALNSIDISSTGKYIIATAAQKICLFDISNSEPIWTYNLGQWYNYGSACCISSDGQYVVAGCDQGAYDTAKIFLFGNENSNPIWTYDTDTDQIYSLDISDNGEYIAAGTGFEGDLGTIVFRSESSTPLWIRSEETIESIAISGNGEHVVAATYVELLHYYNTESSTRIYTHNIFPTPASFVAVDISYDGRSFVSCDTEGNVYYYYDGVPSEFILSSNASDSEYNQWFMLNWSASDKATHYDIYESDHYFTLPSDGILIQSNLEGLNYSINKNQEDDFYYLVVAKNSYGTQYSNCIQIKVRIPPGPFILQTNATNPQLTRNFNLNWTVSIGADNYSVYMYSHEITEFNESLLLIKENLTNSQRSINISSPKGIYHYVVIAYNSSGITLSNDILVNIQVPPESFNLSELPNPYRMEQFNLTWTESPSADNYTIIITDYNSSNVVYLLSGCINCSELITGILSGTYNITIVAINQYGNVSSNSILLIVDLMPGEFFISYSVNPLSTNQFFINWSKSFNADYYSIYECNNLGNQMSLVVENINGLNFSLNIASIGDHYIVVVSYNEYGNFTSNIIHIFVENPSGGFLIPSNYTFFIMTIFIITVAYGLILKKKIKK